MTGTGTVIAIRHVAFEHLGLQAPLLAARGYAVEYREAGIGVPALRVHAGRVKEGLHTRGQAMLQDWLAVVGLR
jgi:hypothetical protein